MSPARPSEVVGDVDPVAARRACRRPCPAGKPATGIVATSRSGGADGVGVDDVLAAARGPGAAAVGRHRRRRRRPPRPALAGVVAHRGDALARRAGRRGRRSSCAPRRSRATAAASPPGESAEASGPWKPVGGARDAELRAGRVDAPAGRRHAGRSWPLRRPRANAAESAASSRMRSDRRRVIERRRTRAADESTRWLRHGSGRVSRYRHAPDGHRLAAGGRAVRDLGRAAVPHGASARRRDGRGRRRRCSALVYDRLPQLRRALRAASGRATSSAGSSRTTGRTSRPPRTRSRRSSRSLAVPFGDAADALLDVADPALLRRCSSGSRTGSARSCSRPLGRASWPRSSC